MNERELFKLIEGIDGSRDERWPLGDFPPNAKLNSPPPSRDMIESVSKYGIIERLVVGLGKNEKVTVLAGNRRIKAARETFDDDFLVDVLVVPWDGAEARFATIWLNSLKKPNPIQDFLAIRDLLGQFGLSAKQIAERSGMSITQVNKYLAMAGMNPKLLDAFLDGRIAPGVAAQIAKRPAQQQAALAGVLEEAGTVRGKDVDEVRKVGSEIAVEQMSFRDTIAAEEQVVPWVVWRQGNAVRLNDGGNEYTVDAKSFAEWLENNQLPF